MDHDTRKRNQESDFKVGLFSCFSSCSNCCAVACCHPCMWGRIAQKVDFLGIKGLVWTIIISILIFSYAVLNQLNISALVNNKMVKLNEMFGLLSLGLFSVLVVLTCVLRTRVREANNISGSALCDFFASLCCSGCAICQMSTEAGLDERAFDICNYPEPETV